MDVLDPVVHGRQRHHVAVFELAEGELGFGLGAVAGHDFGHGPGVVVGDQDVFAEQLFFQRGAGGGVDRPGQAEVWGVAGRSAARGRLGGVRSLATVCV